MPGRIGELGLFESAPQNTQNIVIEEREGSLAILPTASRGSQQQTSNLSTPTRRMRTLVAPHVPQWDEVLAVDLEGRRAFGTEDRTEIFSAVVNDRLERMKQNHELTWEWHRMGALRGNILDADGSTVLYNLFNEFGVTQSTIACDFTSVDMKMFSQQVWRNMQNALGNTSFKGIRAFCGNQFWDTFISHASVKGAYDRYVESNQWFARTLQIPGTSGGGGFEFGEITWENYRGQIGAVPFMPSTKAIFFPTGTRGVFLEIDCPADFVETVGTRGKPIYVKQERMKYDKGVELHSQSNRMYLCTRPKCLIESTGSNMITSPTIVNPA
jgi:hypothetical protein